MAPFVNVFCLWFLLRLSNGYLTYDEVKYPLKGSRSPPGCPWPYPEKWEKCEVLVTINPKTFAFKTNVASCGIIDAAIERYKKLTLIDKNGKKANDINVLDSLKIDVESGYECGYPSPDEDESYKLDIPHGGVSTLKSKTIWGALRGLETFSQLVYQSRTGSYFLNVTKIEDKPRYKYRGVMLDTSRHYISERTIKDNLDAMAYNKLNVFHWHIVDDQSFPYQSKIFPNLTDLGAYGRYYMYTQRQIKDIVQYARNRGIRVIPEFSSPAHTQSFGKAFHHLLSPCYGDGSKIPYRPNYTFHAHAEMLNPTLDETYQVYQTLIKEVKDVFSDEYIHLGMDRVYYDCWESSPTIKEFMKDKGYTEFSQVEEFYVKKTLQNMKKLGYNAIIWQDPVDNGVKIDNRTIVQLWKNKQVASGRGAFEYLDTVADRGHRIIFSSCWHLDRVSYGEDWRKYYNCDPSKHLKEKEQDLLIGGAILLWTEYIDDNNLLPTLWPRASAVAERLWSPRTVDDTDSAQYRLDEHRCRMIRRGIPAQPVRNGYCDHEWKDFTNATQSHRIICV